MILQIKCGEFQREAPQRKRNSSAAKDTKKIQLSVNSLSSPLCWVRLTGFTRGVHLCPSIPGVSLCPAEPRAQLLGWQHRAAGTELCLQCFGHLPPQGWGGGLGAAASHSQQELLLRKEELLLRTLRKVGLCLGCCSFPPHQALPFQLAFPTFYSPSEAGVLPVRRDLVGVYPAYKSFGKSRVLGWLGEVV